MSQLEPLATGDDVLAVLPRDLIGAELGRLTPLLDSASAAVRAFCRRDFTVATSTIRVKPIGDQLRLPNPPVTAVSSVKRVNMDGSLTGFAGWAWDGGQMIYGLSCLGSPMINAPAAWTDYLYTPMVEVTYTHGDATVPQVVKDVVVSMVCQVFLAPTAFEGMTSESMSGVGGYQLANGSPGVTPQLSDSHKQRLRDAGFTAGRGNTTVALRP